MLYTTACRRRCTWRACPTAGPRWSDCGPEVVAALIQCGANVNARDAEMTTPLMYASRAGNVAVVQALLQGHCDLTMTDARGMTALMHACSLAIPSVTQILLAADPHGLSARDSSHWGALHWATAVRAHECVWVLLGSPHAQADLASWESGVDSPLHLAARNGDIPVCSAARTVLTCRSSTC